MENGFQPRFQKIWEVGLGLKEIRQISVGTNCLGGIGHTIGIRTTNNTSAPERLPPLLGANFPGPGSHYGINCSLQIDKNAAPPMDVSQRPSWLVVCVFNSGRIAGDYPTKMFRQPNPPKTLCPLSKIGVRLWLHFILLDTLWDKCYCPWRLLLPQLMAEHISSRRKISKRVDHYLHLSASSFQLLN